MTIYLDGHHLTFKQIKKVLDYEEEIEIHKEAWKRIETSRQTIEKLIQEDLVVYGVTTGFGKLSDVIIPQNQVEQLQMNLIRSHAVGVGKPLSERIVRAMILLRVNALAKGYSGICKETLQLLVDCLNAGIHPVVPSQGSLGASGDLAPLAHLALVLMGEGEAMVKGERLTGLDALERKGLNPIRLKAKEGLALINGTQAMTAVGVVTYLDASDLANWAEQFASLTFEALNGVIDAFDDQIHQVRAYPEQIEVAQNMRGYLEGSQLTTHQGDLRVQDAYSLRCIPQVHGAIRQVLNYVKEKLEIEMNSATDNPLIFSDHGEVISGGNFHGQPIAFAMDFLKIALAELANIAERRIERLVNPQLSGLPPFLSVNPGLESGFMIMQYVAAALVSENKTLAHPASVDSIPSSANQEDHVSMGMTAARHAYQVLKNSRRVVAIEAICAAQALEFREIEKCSPHSKSLYRQIRKWVPPLTGDRVLANDVERLTAWLKKANKENSKV
ncbi:histidine ammonia-lyase [Seinonella peptonophila]|uniref:Histidine ammonia-lyase n=1 Tax=Seinonella peptonophila TaxID=112248 RepID=A0A1M4W998_9BACL|nr:histidine ammonia-lyase [Seinonella peptonophila]SHE77663.1 histidine ammonia-lyase [Seinonella peptonophila]